MTNEIRDNVKGRKAVHMKTESSAQESPTIVEGIWGVRYQVKDISRAVAFYTHLGFKLDMQYPPAFAAVSIGDFKLILSGPGTSGARPMPDGRSQEPGGWNRIMLQVTNLQGRVAGLKEAGLHFRNDIEVGPGGKQIQLEDPDGNPIELFEPAGKASQLVGALKSKVFGS